MSWNLKVHIFLVSFTFFQIIKISLAFKCYLRSVFCPSCCSRVKSLSSFSFGISSYYTDYNNYNNNYENQNDNNSDNVYFRLGLGHRNESPVIRSKNDCVFLLSIRWVDIFSRKGYVLSKVFKMSFLFSSVLTIACAPNIAVFFCQLDIHAKISVCYQKIHSLRTFIPSLRNISLVCEQVHRIVFSDAVFKRYFNSIKS